VPCELTPGGPNPCAALGTFCIAADGIHGFCRPEPDGVDSGPMPDAGPRPDGGCVAADGAMELCNGEDDDCDGEIDDGHDGDGDGVTWCGGGNPAYADCDDGSPAAHPAYPPGGVAAAAEACDGLDNDCNGMIDDGATVCPGGQVCSAGVCYGPTDCRLPGNACVGVGEICNLTLTPAACEGGGCTAGSCTSPEVCNLESGDCVMPMPVGSGCGTDADCASQMCAPAAALGVPMTPATSSICASSCCRDDQCGDGQICWATGNGPKLCVPQELVGGTRGPGAARASCTVGSECMSGLCFSSGGCLGNCASHSDCAGDLRCAEATFDRGSQRAFTQLICRGNLSGAGAGEFCLGNGWCRYDWCWVSQTMCGGPCRSHADCGTSGAYCGITGVVGGGGRIDRYRECRPKGHAGAGVTGGNCMRPDDCRDYLCAEGQCADACCADADCTASGRRCRLRDMGGGTYGTFCLPPAAG